MSLNATVLSDLELHNASTKILCLASEASKWVHYFQAHFDLTFTFNIEMDYMRTNWWLKSQTQSKKILDSMKKLQPLTKYRIETKSKL